MVHLKPILRSVQQTFEAYDLMIIWIASISEHESRQVCIMSLRRQLEAMRRELEELENACLQAVHEEHEQSYTSLVQMAKVLQQHYPSPPGCGYSNEDLTVLRETYVKADLESEADIEKFFRHARRKLFQLSVSARAL